MRFPGLLTAYLLEGARLSRQTGITAMKSMQPTLARSVFVTIGRRLALALLVVWCGSQAGKAAPLPRATPESQGVSSASALEFIDALEQRIEGMHSVMIVRHGRVIVEGWWAPYAAARPHVLYSLSKSFTSTAVGLAVAEGKLSIDDEVLKFFPEAAPAAPSPHLKAMRVRDLLTMSTGHQDEPPTGADVISAKSFLSQPVPHLPGTHFKYNTAATFMLSAIVQKVTGLTTVDYLGPRLFAPLGIEPPVWDANFEGISLGGYGLRVRTENIAKFGQLYLQQGRWHGKQLLPAEWIAQATSKQVSNGSDPASDWNQGYGFQFWRCRHHAYRGDGAFGQYCLVLPDQDMVVAITSGVKNMQAVLNVVWDKLLPFCEAHRVRVDRAAQDRLHSRLAELRLPLPQGAASSSLMSRVLDRRYVFPANAQDLAHLSVGSADAGRTLQLELQVQGRTLHVACGHENWLLGRGLMPAGRLAQFPDEPLAGSYAWPADDRLLIRLCGVETPFVVTFQLRFEGDRVTLDAESNVAFGAAKWPTLTSTASSPSPAR